MRDWNRKGALEEIESLKQIRATGWEQHSHSYKWLTGSLLALNGGGLIGIGQMADVAPTDRVEAGFFFALGIAFALLVAVFNQRAIMTSFQPLQKQVGYWMTVAADGIRDENFEEELNKDAKPLRRLGWIGQGLGWISALCFFGGIYFSGVGLLEQPQFKGNVDEVGTEQSND